MPRITVFWFRRDLRLEDNHGLFRALTDRAQVQGLFIFDDRILGRLQDPADPRVGFLHQTLGEMKSELHAQGSDLWIRKGQVLDVWKQLLVEHDIEAVYTNEDYEPEARERDQKVQELLSSRDIPLISVKDQCLFAKDEILTDAGKPYTVYTPYKKKVLASLKPAHLKSYEISPLRARWRKVSKPEPMFPWDKLGFQKSKIEIPPPVLSSQTLKAYQKNRDFPALAEGTTRLGLHLRFGTLSVRELAREGLRLSDTWLSELIWRDFFMQVLWHHPRVVKQSFRPEYDKVEWRNSASDLERWKNGETGYPLVDAGMRELNTTGHMHNRVRMVVASFLTKHLLIHWLEGERDFASKLLDFDLSANNGNWQWAAGTGCDAAPYFRVFNPEAQAKKFDPEGEYIRRWVPEWGSSKYPSPMVEHNFARGRALSAFHKALKGVSS